MKKWFLSQDDKTKKYLTILWCPLTFLILLLAPAGKFFAFLFWVTLVIGILITKWYKEEKNASEKSVNDFSLTKATDNVKKRGELNKDLTDQKHISARFEKETDPEKEAAIQKAIESRLEEENRMREEAQEELEKLPRFEIELSEEKINRKTGYEAPNFSNVTLKGKYDEFVVFDVETTGLEPYRDRIIELAAVRFVDGIPTEVFETFINPERKILEQASKINHITDEMVTDAPTISQVLPSFEKFVADSPLVAHNLEFDLKFIYFSGSNVLETPRKYFDTLSIAQKMLKRPKNKRKYDKEYEMWETVYDYNYDVENHKLETLAKYYKITCPSKHRSAGDAIVTGKLFLHLIEDKKAILEARKQEKIDLC